MVQSVTWSTFTRTRTPDSFSTLLKVCTAVCLPWNGQTGERFTIPNTLPHWLLSPRIWIKIRLKFSPLLSLRSPPFGAFAPFREGSFVKGIDLIWICTLNTIFPHFSLSTGVVTVGIGMEARALPYITFIANMLLHDLPGTEAVPVRPSVRPQCYCGSQ